MWRNELYSPLRPRPRQAGRGGVSVNVLRGPRRAARVILSHPLVILSRNEGSRQSENEMLRQTQHDDDLVAPQSATTPPMWRPTTASPAEPALRYAPPRRANACS